MYGRWVIGWWLVMLLAAVWAGAAPVRSVIMLVHGVNTDTRSYTRFKERIWAPELADSALLEVHWGRESCVHASGSVGERPNLVVGMSNKAWVGVSKLKDVTAQCRRIVGPSVPITVLCHSQGAVIALAALQEGLTVDNLIMLGATLGTESVRTGARNTRLGLAARQVRGTVFNLWSSSDQTVQFAKGGIGGRGLPGQIPDYTSGNLRDVRIDKVDHTGDTGWWAMGWLRPEYHKSWHGATRDEVMAALRGPGPTQPLTTQQQTELAALQDYARRDTFAGWFGEGDDDALTYTFTLLPGLMNGVHFDDKDWCQATVTCREGRVRCRIQAAPWSRFDRGTAWRTLDAGQTAMLSYALEGIHKDAMVFLQVEGLSTPFARAECAFTAKDR